MAPELQQTGDCTIIPRFPLCPCPLERAAKIASQEKIPANNYEHKNRECFKSVLQTEFTLYINSWNLQVTGECQGVLLDFESSTTMEECLDICNSYIGTIK